MSTCIRHWHFAWSEENKAEQYQRILKQSLLSISQKAKNETTVDSKVDSDTKSNQKCFFIYIQAGSYFSHGLPSLLTCLQSRASHQEAPAVSYSCWLHLTLLKTLDILPSMGYCRTSCFYNDLYCMTSSTVIYITWSIPHVDETMQDWGFICLQFRNCWVYLIYYSFSYQDFLLIQGSCTVYTGLLCLCNLHMFSHDWDDFDLNLIC